jgi:hypothetical protein
MTPEEVKKELENNFICPFCSDLFALRNNFVSYVHASKSCILTSFNIWANYISFNLKTNDKSITYYLNIKDDNFFNWTHRIDKNLNSYLDGCNSTGDLLKKIELLEFYH